MSAHIYLQKHRHKLNSKEENDQETLKHVYQVKLNTKFFDRLQ